MLPACRVHSLDRHRPVGNPAGARRATLLTRTSGSLSSRMDLLLVADAELFRPATDAAACSRRLQSRQRAFADDIALEPAENIAGFEALAQLQIKVTFELVPDAAFSCLAPAWHRPE